MMLRPLFFSLLLCVGVAHAADERLDPYTHFFNDSFGDYSEELQTARDEGKKGVMIFFEMDECPFCHWMKKNVLNRAEVQAYFREHFLLFAHDIEGDLEIVDFEGNTTTQKDYATDVHDVQATPVFLFFDLDGKPVQRYTGKTRNADEFLWLGEFVADAHYRETNFSKYKKAKRRQARQR